MAEIKVATDDTFEALVLHNDKPVVVDFWAAWCGPCKMVAPEMEKLAAKYDGPIDVVKVDVDANPRPLAGVQHHEHPDHRVLRARQAAAWASSASGRWSSSSASSASARVRGPGGRQRGQRRPPAPSCVALADSQQTPASTGVVSIPASRGSRRRGASRRGARPPTWRAVTRRTRGSARSRAARGPSMRRRERDPAVAAGRSGRCRACAGPPVATPVQPRPRAGGAHDAGHRAARRTADVDPWRSPTSRARSTRRHRSSSALDAASDRGDASARGTRRQRRRGAVGAGLVIGDRLGAAEPIIGAAARIASRSACGPRSARSSRRRRSAVVRVLDPARLRHDGQVAAQLARRLAEPAPDLVHRQRRHAPGSPR